MPHTHLYPLASYPRLIINAAITGMVPGKAQTPHIPVTEDEIVADAVACCHAGAAIVHLHVRDENGLPDYRAERYARVIRRIRAECDIIICASTSARRYPEFEKRAEVLYLQGDEKPEMASLTTGSFNFPAQASINPPEVIQKLAAIMLENNIKPEFEIFDSGMLNYALYLDRKMSFPKPLYFNFLLGSVGGMQARIDDLAYLTRGLPEHSYWAASGMGVFQLPVNCAAMISGGGVRTGLEDNIYFDNGKNQLGTNVQMIERIVTLARLLGREIATPAEARGILRLSSSGIQQSAPKTARERMSTLL